MNLKYEELSERFAKLTSNRSDNGLCCVRQWNGAPECCVQVSLNDSCNVVSETELKLIQEGEIWEYDLSGVLFPDEGFRYVKIGKFWFLHVVQWQLVAKSLHLGLLAGVLENTSHPTRPVMSGGDVVDVVALEACIGEWAMDDLRGKRDEFLLLWMDAVDMVGVKPYYPQLDMAGVKL